MQTAKNARALAAAEDPRVREKLIEDSAQVILRTASRVCRRFVTRSDDEWSVALYAFSQAIDSYDETKGDFLPFAQMLIKRALVDYHRGERNHLSELSVSPQVLDGSAEPEEDTEGVYLAVAENIQRASDTSLQQEILAANELLSSYGFRFFDLTECSPQQEKTRRQCAAAVRWMLERPEALMQLQRTHKLPVRELAAASGVPRKTLDRYRKYIIMAVLILHDDYPRLSAYLRFIKEGAGA